MPIITIHTTKAGQGATVTAATLCAAAGQRTPLIDAATGDVPRPRCQRNERAPVGGSGVTM